MNAVKLSRAQRKWLMNEIMGGTYQYEEWYKPLWDELNVDYAITAIEQLKCLMEGVVDRVNYGDRDKQAYRDRGYGLRILEKIRLGGS